MKTREEVIIEAFGEAWEVVCESVNGDGWVIGLPRDSDHPLSPTVLGFSKLSDFDVKFWAESFDWRPSSLSGIENNNGWIKTQDKLPSDADMVNYCMYGIVDPEPISGKMYKYMLERTKNMYTHWKIAVKNKNPLF